MAKAEAGAAAAAGGEARERQTRWHAVPAERALEQLESSSAGLDDAEAARRL